MFWTVSLYFMSFILMSFFSNPSVLTPSIFILVVYLGMKLMSWEDLSVGSETQMGVDMTAYWYFFLSLIVMKLSCMAASCEKFDFKKQTLFALLGILNLSVFNLLMTENPFIFYILYEFLVIPIILIICFWGSSVERIHAMQSLLLYTVICASPLIFYLAGSKAISGVEVLLNCFSASIMPFMLSEPGSGFKGILGIVLGFSFLVKFPQFAMHMWLPKAHVEAPVYGSMELAGILLKLGVVGWVRFSPLYHDFGMVAYIMGLSLANLTVTAYTSMDVVDIKVLVAYSSILHMAMFMGSICIGDSLSFKISYLSTMMHSFCSCGLFYIGFLFSLKTGDRTILNFKSMGSVDKFLLKFYIYFMFASAGAPPSLNLFLEVVMFASSSSMLMYLVNIFFLSLVLASVCVVIPISYSLGGGDLKKGDSKKLFNKLKIFNNVYLLLAILVLTTILANFFVLDFLLLN